MPLRGQGRWLQCARLVDGGFMVRSRVSARSHRACPHRSQTIFVQAPERLGAEDKYR